MELLNDFAIGADLIPVALPSLLDTVSEWFLYVTNL